MKHEERVYIDDVMMQEAIDKHTEKQLLCYATELLRQGRLENEGIVDDLIELASRESDLSSMEESREGIYQSVIRESASSYAKSDMIGGKRIAAAIVAGILVVVTCSNVIVEAIKAKRFSLGVEERKFGYKYLTVDGDYSDAELPGHLEEIHVPDGYYFRDKEYMSFSRREYCAYVFDNAEDSKKNVFVRVMLPDKNIQYVLGGCKNDVETYRYKGIDHYIAEILGGTGYYANWIEDSVIYFVCINESLDECKDLIKEVHRVVDKHKTNR